MADREVAEAKEELHDRWWWTYSSISQIHSGDYTTLLPYIPGLDEMYGDDYLEYFEPDYFSGYFGTYGEAPYYDDAVDAVLEDDYDPAAWTHPYMSPFPNAPYGGTPTIITNPTPRYGDRLRDAVDHEKEPDEPSHPDVAYDLSADTAVNDFPEYYNEVADLIFDNTQ